MVRIYYLTHHLLSFFVKSTCPFSDGEILKTIHCLSKVFIEQEISMEQWYEFQEKVGIVDQEAR